MNGNKSDNGLPFIAEDDGFIERLAKLSEPLGVSMHKQDNVYVCHWQRGSENEIHGEIT